MASEFQINAAQSAGQAPVDLQQKVTWVGCDACGRWRKVSQVFAESLDEEKDWFCEQNPDPAYNSCSAPQELSDQEIDLNLAANSGADLPKQQRPAVWQHVTENIFTHRARKLEDEDDIMVCQCHPPRDGSLGCVDSCLNRMLNQECNPDFCPCGSLCSNTQFARRRYASLEQRRAGPKGFGLFTKEDLQPGQFVIEYVGEVLEEEEYLRRKMFYQDVGQRHYYFMNIGNGEVIDACRKGALGRFINHSCNPNCETQKWIVHGELAIGLFALKPIPAGEELTFDYNFERYGDKALKCYCESSNCRGYIGGTPEEQSDMDDNLDAWNDPEPIMVGKEDATSNPACRAILANEVGLAAADFQDDQVRKGWEELAAKYNISLDWDAVSKEVVLPAESAEESRAMMGEATPPAAAFEVVEQKLKDSKTHQRLQNLAASRGLTSRKPSSSRKTASSSAGNPPISALQDGAAHSSTTSNHISRQPKWQGQVRRGFRRRSEVDRRLDNLVGASGKLRDAGMSSIIKLLRLFNLCDLGNSGMPGSPSAKAVTAASSRTAAPTSMSDGRKDAFAGSEDSKQFEPKFKKARLDSRSSPSSRSPTLEREEGEIGERPLESRSSVWEQTHAEPVSEAHARDSGAREPSHLTSRQRARMADLSLLLDVILKTTSTSTKQEFCKCGILRQLQSVIGRCTGQAHLVIVKKILRAVDHLPLNPEDLHQHSSAQGSFFDTLFASGMHSDFEIRSKARALKEKFPLEACSKEIQEAARAARAAAQAKRMQRSFRRRHHHNGDSGNGVFPQTSGQRYGRGPLSRSWGSKPQKPFEPSGRGGAHAIESVPRRPRDRSERESRFSDRSPAAVHVQEALHRNSSQASPMPFPPAWGTPHLYQQGSAGAPPLWREPEPQAEMLHRLHFVSSAVPSHQFVAGLMHSPSFGPPLSSPQNSISPSRQNHAHQPCSVGPSLQTSARFPGPDMGSLRELDLTREHSKTGERQWPGLHQQASSIASPQFRSPPPLPTDPPPVSSSPKAPSVSIAGSPMSAGLPSVSPVTPNGASQGEPGSPPILSGAYMEEKAGSDEKADRRTGNAQQASSGVSDWRVPAWQIDPKGSQLQSKLAALAAPLPAPGILPSNSGVHLTADATNGSLPLMPRNANGAAGLTERDTGSGSPSPKDGPQSWDRPNTDFDEFVGKVIAHRLGKYKQPNHPNHISQDEYKELYKKSRRAIIDAERKAYEERQRNRTFKLIEREKLESRVKDYVRDLIRRVHDRKLAGSNNSRD